MTLCALGSRMLPLSVTLSCAALAQAPDATDTHFRVPPALDGS